MKPFKQLGLRGQKRRIVKDAIEQIKTGVVTPWSGKYFTMNFYNLENKSSYSSYSLQKILKEGIEDTCDACAKGALLASCVLNVNKVRTDDPISENRFISNKLSKWFEVGELDAIEAAFERDIIHDQTDILYGTSLGKKAINFGNRFNDDKKRLLAILKNILKHGKFKP
jgi:hypothetical protein